MFTSSWIKILTNVSQTIDSTSQTDNVVKFITIKFVDFSFGACDPCAGISTGSAGAIILVVGLVLAILSPVIAQLVKLAISRKREFMADASAALMTRYPEGLASAWEKIAKDKEPLEAANHATAHLYIANPFKEKGFLTGLFSTHPKIEDRIKALRSM